MSIRPATQAQPSGRGIARRGSLAIAVLAVLFTFAARAEQMQRLGPYEAHYVVVATTFFNETIAERYAIVRGRDRALMNLSILDDEGNPVAVAVEGEMTNLLGQVSPLSFREVREGTAVYYLAPVKHTDRETLRFRVTITTPDGVARELRFQQQLFWEGR